MFIKKNHFYITLLLIANISFVLSCSESSKKNVLEQFMDTGSQEVIVDEELHLSLIVSTEVEKWAENPQRIGIRFQFKDEEQNILSRNDTCSLSEILKFEKKLVQNNSLAAQAYTYYMKNRKVVSILYDDWTVINAGKYGNLFCTDFVCYTKYGLKIHYFIINYNSYNKLTMEKLFLKYPDEETLYKKLLSDLEWYLKYEYAPYTYIKNCKKITIQEAKQIIENVISQFQSDTKRLSLLQKLEIALKSKVKYITSQIKHKYRFDQDAVKWMRLSGLSIPLCISISVYLQSLSKSMSYKSGFCLASLYEALSLALSVAPSLNFLYCLYTTLTKDPNEENKYLLIYKELLEFVIELHGHINSKQS